MDQMVKTVNLDLLEVVVVLEAVVAVDLLVKVEVVDNLDNLDLQVNKHGFHILGIEQFNQVKVEVHPHNKDVVDEENGGVDILTVTHHIHKIEQHLHLRQEQLRHSLVDLIVLVDLLVVVAAVDQVVAVEAVDQEDLAAAVDQVVKEDKEDLLDKEGIMVVRDIKGLLDLVHLEEDGTI
tara:strand:- start:1350 stop:1886 length:537 start_codon:yes stop_codon:yes gene_type:complete